MGEKRTDISYLIYNPEAKFDVTYPHAVLKKAVNGFMEVVRNNLAFGVFLEDYNCHDPQRIKLMDTAFLVKDMFFVEEQLWADIEVLGTPKGRVLAKVLSDVALLVDAALLSPTDVFAFGLIGEGTILNSEIQEDYQISGISFTLRHV